MKKASEGYKAPSSAIILGAPGSGKTTLVSQFPGLFLLDCDENAGGPITWLKSQKKSTDFYIASPLRDDEGKEVPRAQQFQRAATLLEEAAAMDDVKTIAIDSLTTFVPIVLTEVLRQQGRRLGNFDFKTANSKTYDEPMQIQDWGAFLGLMRTFIMKLKATGKTLVIIGHLKTKEDDVNKMMRQFINVPGQLADIISGWFSEVWLLEANMEIKKGKKTETRKVTTFPQSKTATTLGLKSSTGVKSGSEINADELVKAFK